MILIVIIYVILINVKINAQKMKIVLISHLIIKIINVGYIMEIVILGHLLQVTKMEVYMSFIKNMIITKQVMINMKEYNIIQVLKVKH